MCEKLINRKNDIISFEGRKADFTGGKWEKYDNRVYAKFDVLPKHCIYKYRVAKVYGDDETEISANARLIASAPEMYRLLLDVVRNEDIYRFTEERIEALIDYIDGKENEMTDSSKFFRNINCEYFPCHKNVDADNFNCLFCFCPLYSMKDCGGNPEYLPNGIKDCTNCIKPHVNYDAVIERLRKESKS